MSIITFFAIISDMNQIERKFLISPDIQRWLLTQQVAVEEIEQFYVYSDSDTSCYYLKRFPDSYTKVTIDKEGQEHRETVTETLYLEARENSIGSSVRKISSTLLIENATFVFWEYFESLQGLYLLVASFETSKSMRESKTLEDLQSFVLKEIDHDQKYSDELLALSIKPMEYDLNKQFENIDAFEAPNLFFWQVPTRLYVRDGVALVLYRNLRLLHHYKVNYQSKHFSATLHRLRVLLRRSANLLEIFPDLFNPNVQQFCTKLLLRYYEETKLMRFLYFLGELCPTRENAKLSLYSELKSLTSQEEQAVTQMLLSRPFVHLIQILTRELYAQENQSYKALNDEVKKVVTQRLEDFEIALSQTKEGYDEAMLQSLYQAIETLQTLIEDFFHIIGDKKAQIIVDELNILFKPLREYRNCKEREAILREIKEQSQNKALDTDPLLCEHEDVLKEKIDNALKLLRTSKFYI